MLRAAQPMAIVMLALGCATTGESLSGQDPGDAAPTSAAPAPASDQGAEVMRALEQRLLDAQEVDIAFEIQSGGALISNFSGTLRWVRDGELLLRATGEFAGEAQELELRADTQTLEVLVAGEQSWAGPRPPALIEAIVLGLTRQGLLHNLAMMTVGSPPERGEGGIGDWLGFVDPQLGPMQAFGAGQAQPLEFGVQVEGQQVGRATLWLRADGLPLERQQVVDFPEGSMQVVERYPKLITK